MNISKHMEFIFLGALALIGASAAATAAVPALMAPLAPTAYIQTLQDNEMQTVVVAAKRLTAEEKAALGE
ncbi:hypothetical protein GCM10027277_41640 [Pseudoduganella ginsengisoli]|uniref:Uncharacterized protein n=1 Tax=Pseudoduganella ginsengisoli TaxID=1462440 RepID=A0A6L6PXV6_9BURK|nr:hypothetical protein [Pseudoduganella ginsengisoli]MTW01768.1 hypothetical protein [Pseudoduganella ginsengisoli]